MPRLKRRTSDVADDGRSKTKRRHSMEDEEDEESRRNTPVNDNTNDNGDDDDDWIEAEKTTHNDDEVEEENTGQKSLCGLIKKLRLNNFMNHGCLEVDFGKNVNFIVGENGSGKSAVLTAIILGLGGKIAQTGRGSKVSKVIKEGTTQADIQIDLYNEGPDAYRPDDYGKVIHIERTIAPRSTSLRIKSSINNRLVSNKMSELTHICDQFSIQVDNPVAVLNQEMSKTFFASTKAQEKYKLFMKATQLDSLKEQYAAVDDSARTISTGLVSKKVELDILKREAIEAENIHTQTQKIQQIGDRVKELEVEIICAYFEELKKGHQKAVEEQEAAEKKVADSEADRANKEEKVRIQHQIETKLKEDLRAINDQVAEAQTAASELKKVQKGWKKFESERRTKEKRRKLLEDEVKTINRRIEKEVEEAQSQYQTQLSRKTQNQNAINEKEDEIARVGVKIKDLDTEIRSLSFEKQSAEEQYQHQIDGINLIQESVKSIKVQIKDVKGGAKDRIAVYGSEMKNLLDQIRKERWKDGAVGPLGMHVKLKEKTWMTPVNMQMSSLFRSFIVYNKQDRNTLSRIMGKVYGNTQRQRQPTIYTVQKEKRFSDVNDYPKNLAGRQYKTIDNVIEVDHDQVWNTFVVNAAIHKVILIEDKDEADHIALRQKYHVNGLIFAGTEGYTHNITGKAQITSTPASFKKKGVNVLQDDVTEEVNRLQWDLNVEEKRLADEKEKCMKAKQKCQQLTSRLKRAEAEYQKQTDYLEKLEREVLNLRNMDDDEPDVPQTQTEQYEADISEKNEEILELSQECTQLTELEMEGRRKEKPMHDKINAIKNQQLELATQVEIIHKKLESVAKEVERLERKIKKKWQEIEGQKKKAMDANASVVSLERDIAEEDAAWAKFGLERVEVTASKSKLEKELKSKKNMLEKDRQTRGKSYDEIAADFHRAKEKYNAKASEVVEQLKFEKAIKEAVTKRTVNLKVFRDYIGKRAQVYFKNTLKKNNYKGKMILEHADGQLRLNVDVKGIDSKKEGAAGLSGGEKSFSTACFIVSLWETMETPFRCLDEFDVFMDAMNRQMAIEMMIDVAKQQPDRQFIYLSPLGMKVLKKYENDNDVRVIRMPRKVLEGQTTLDGHLAGSA